MTNGQWCADFVNGALKANGIGGSGSSVANSFLKWGTGVAPGQVAKGDVLVESRGRGAGAPGGHVGIATGQTRTNPRTGETEIEQVSGNYGGKVARSWERAGKLDVRRAFGSPDIAAGFKPDASSVAGAVPPTPQSITRDIPVSPRGTGPGGQGAGPGGSAGTVMHNTWNIDAGQQSPRDLANAVQRHVTEAWNRRGHDLEPEMT